MPTSIEPTIAAVPVRGGDLEVGVWEGGPPAVLALHGGTSSHRVWRATVRALGGAAKVVAPDLRGWASSSRLPGPYGIETHVDDARRVLDHLGLDRVIVAGWSLGGFIAANVALALSDRAQALVLLDGGVPLSLPTGFEPLRVLDDLIATVRARHREPPVSRAAHRAAWRDHPALARRELWNEEIQRMFDDEIEELPDGSVRLRVPIDSLRGDVLDTLTDPTRDAAHRVRCPMVFVWAERGLQDEPIGYYPIATARAFAETTGARLVEVHDRNHYELLLAPDGAQIIADTLRSAARRDGLTP